MNNSEDKNFTDNTNTTSDQLTTNDNSNQPEPHTSTDNKLSQNKKKVIILVFVLIILFVGFLVFKNLNKTVDVTPINEDNTQVEDYTTNGEASSGALQDISGDGPPEQVNLDVPAGAFYE